MLFALDQCGASQHRIEVDKYVTLVIQFVVLRRYKHLARLVLDKKILVFGLSKSRQAAVVSAFFMKLKH